jgi:hypothetical protein
MKRSTDISMDLETLDNSPRSLVLSIGAAAFDREGLQADALFEVHVSIWSQWTRTLSWDTITWWLKQSKEAKKQMIEGQKKAVSLRVALEKLQSFIEQNTEHDARVWGNGAAFDNAILEDAYKNTIKGRVPWAFWNDRCLRTLLDEHEAKTKRNLKKEIPFVGERHGALADAVHQAKLIRIATRELRG